jgi:hypothetical protein
MFTASQLAAQQEQEHKERGDKTELQTTPNEEGKAKEDHGWREKKILGHSRVATHSSPPRLSTGNPLEAIKRAPSPCDCCTTTQ